MRGGKNEKRHRGDATSGHLHLSGVASRPEGLLQGYVRLCLCFCILRTASVVISSASRKNLYGSVFLQGLTKNDE